MSGRRSRRDSRCCKRPHLPRPRPHQRPPTRLQRRSGRPHVVHEEDGGAGGDGRWRADPEGLLDVGVALSRWQIRLRRRVPAADEGMPDREAEAARQIRCLVEATPPAAAPMQRHRDDEVGPREEGVTVHPHEEAEPGSDRPAPLILERLQHGAERVVVFTNGPRDSDRAAAPAAPRTSAASAGRAPAAGRLGDGRRPQRVAASVAERWRQRPDAAPAGLADGGPRRARQRARARGAQRRDGHGQHRVHKGPHDGGFSGRWWGRGSTVEQHAAACCKRSAASRNRRRRAAPEEARGGVRSPRSRQRRPRTQVQPPGMVGAADQSAVLAAAGSSVTAIRSASPQSRSSE